MEGYSSLFDKHLSTVWSAPNYCYRCGNSASILEVGPGETMFFNVFEAAPENDRDGPNQQSAQNANGKVRVRATLLAYSPILFISYLNTFFNTPLVKLQLSESGYQLLQYDIRVLYNNMMTFKRHSNCYQNWHTNHVFRHTWVVAPLQLRFLMV